MLDLTSGSELLKQEGSNCKKKKWHGNLDSMTFQQNRMNILTKKSTLKLPEIIEASTFIIKKVKTRI